MERLHRTVKQRLDKMRLDGHSCDEALTIILRKIRSSPADGTGKTPFSLMFGREMKGRYMLLDPTRRVTCPRLNVVKKYRQADQRNKAKLVEFAAGDRIMMRNGKTSKFFRYGNVLFSVGHGAWKVRFENGTTRVVNQRFLRLCGGYWHGMPV